jgi:predicted GTPase
MTSIKTTTNNLQSAIRNPQLRGWRVWTIVACLIVPLLGIGAVGGLWLHERGWLGWAGLAFLCGETLTLVLFRRWGRQREGVLSQPSSALPPTFAPRDEPAWAIVQEYLARVDRQEIVLTSKEQLFALGQEVLERVATCYHPHTAEPFLAVQIPQLFRAIEETARDLANLTRDVPFAHKITIGDAVRGYQLQQRLRPAYNAYRALYPLFNWQNAVFQLFVTDRLFDVAKQTLAQWLLKWYVDRIGYHAIELYSGRLTLTRRVDSEAYFALPSPTASGKDFQPVSPGPLRVLILGQVKAGKSSLTNALFGQYRAVTDVLPATAQLTSYVLERAELGATLIVSDMGGYEDPSAPQERLEEAFTEALQSDLILLVVSAVNVAREPDRQLLTQLRAHFAQHPELRTPPVVAVLTHIDLLRPPREWAPPYNVVTPDSQKAHSIRGAMNTVAADVGLAAENIVPVCPLPERMYNVEEALMPLLLALVPEAKRTLLIRSLKTLREREQWEILGRQSRATGRFLMQFGAEVLKKTVERVLEEGRL